MTAPVRGVLRGLFDSVLHGLAGRLLVAFFALAVLLPGTALVAITGLSEQALRSEMIAKLSALADTRAGAIETWFQERRRAVLVLARQPETRRALDRCAAGLDEADDCLAHRRAFQGALETAGYADLMLIDAKTATIVLSVTHPKIIGQSLTAAPYRDSGLAQAVTTVQTLLGPAVSQMTTDPETDQPAVFIAAPVFDAAQRIVGVLAVRLPPGSLSSQATDYAGLGRSGETVIVVPSNGLALVIAPLRHIAGAPYRLSVPLAGTSLSLPMLDAALGLSGEGARLDYRGETVIAAWRHLPTLGGGLVVKMDAREVFAPVQNLRRLLLLVTLGVLLVVAVAAGLVARTISRPIKALTRTAQAVAAGDLDQRAPVGGEDEIGVFAATFNRMVADLQTHYDTIEDKVRQRTEELQRETETSRRLSRQIVESIEYGSRIQRALLPDPALLSDRVVDLAVAWMPRDMVGGDIHWWVPTDDGFLLVVADCTGHGVPGAFMTIIVSTCLNSLRQSPEARDPAWLLAALNTLVKQALQQTHRRRGPDDGLDAVACVVSHRARELRVAGAKLGAFIRRHGLDSGDGSGRVEEIRGTGVALGYARSPAVVHLDTHRLPLEGGLTVILTTDGLIDQVGGERGRPLGRTRFHESVSESIRPTAQETVDAMVARLEDWRGARPVLDDRTLVVFRV